MTLAHHHNFTLRYNDSLSTMVDEQQLPGTLHSLDCIGVRASTVTRAEPFSPGSRKCDTPSGLMAGTPTTDDAHARLIMLLVRNDTIILVQGQVRVCCDQGSKSSRDECVGGS